MTQWVAPPAHGTPRLQHKHRFRTVWVLVLDCVCAIVVFGRFARAVRIKNFNNAANSVVAISFNRSARKALQHEVAEQIVFEAGCISFPVGQIGEVPIVVRPEPLLGTGCVNDVR